MTYTIDLKHFKGNFIYYLFSYSFSHLRDDNGDDEDDDDDGSKQKQPFIGLVIV